MTPKVWSFSLGFQYQVSRNSTLEASYVGSRSYDLNMDAAYNIPSASFEKQCDLYRGGSPLYCQQQAPNPFKGNPLFIGQSFYTSNTVNRDVLARPFTQFNGDVHQYGRNDSWIRYNSLQLNYNVRMRGGLTLLANYTLSKQMELWGFNDIYTRTYQQGLYFLDHPQVLKLTEIYELPFGEGKHWGAGSNKFVKTLISGWQWTNFFNEKGYGIFSTEGSQTFIQAHQT